MRDLRWLSACVQFLGDERHAGKLLKRTVSFITSGGLSVCLYPGTAQQVPRVLPQGTAGEDEVRLGSMHRK